MERRLLKPFVSATTYGGLQLSFRIVSLSGPSPSLWNPREGSFQALLYTGSTRWCRHPAAVLRAPIMQRVGCTLPCMSCMSCMLTHSLQFAPHANAHATPPAVFMYTVEFQFRSISFLIYLCNSGTLSVFLVNFLFVATGWANDRACDHKSVCQKIICSFVKF